MGEFTAYLCEIKMAAARANVGITCMIMHFHALSCLIPPRGGAQTGEFPTTGAVHLSSCELARLVVKSFAWL